MEKQNVKELQKYLKELKVDIEELKFMIKENNILIKMFEDKIFKHFEEENQDNMWYW